MNFVTIIGARPQFIKAAPVSRELRKNHTECLVHTGQHYDKNMSDVFFEELHIPKPDYNLGIGSGMHGEQTGEMLKGIEKILHSQKPDYVLVYGDTNSTLAGALAASKMHIPVIHVESGLRSFNKRMPEEINRILTDHVSSLLFCPTDTAVRNLAKEGIENGVINIGDVMYDAVLFNKKIADGTSKVLEQNSLKAGEYYLITVHRAENTDDDEKLTNIINALREVQGTKVWPIHPRTKKIIEKLGIDLSDVPGLLVIEPVGYLDMLKLEANAKKILTDSGGVQKEAYFMKVPCVTLREETEWVETLEGQANILVGSNVEKILSAVNKNVNPQYQEVFGDGHSAEKMLKYI